MFGGRVFGSKKVLISFVPPPKKLLKNDKIFISIFKVPKNVAYHVLKFVALSFEQCVQRAIAHENMLKMGIRQHELSQGQAVDELGQ